jgi:hypothetical protein
MLSIAVKESRRRAPAGSKPSRITVALLREALEEIVAEQPEWVDERPALELPPRYVTHGQPACLVARVLTRMGYSIGILRALDLEFRQGEIATAGVRIVESRHPALRRLEPQARLLLEFVQRGQDRGFTWGHIIQSAFTPSRFGRRFDMRRRPWLYTRDGGIA